MTRYSLQRVGTALVVLLVVGIVGSGCAPVLHDHDASPDTCAVCRIVHETHFLPASGTAVLPAEIPLVARIGVPDASCPDSPTHTRADARAPPHDS